MAPRRIIVPPSTSMLPRTIHRVQPQRDYHEHEDGFEPFPEGVVQTPDACWDQHPEADKIARFYKPERQWGDQEIQAIVEGEQFTFGQFLDLKLHLPAVVSLRLSSVDIQNAITAPLTSLFVDWTLDIGCGRALQIVQLRQLVQPQAAQAGATLTDLSIQLPVHALRVSAQLTFQAGILGKKPTVQMVAMVAPFTSYPEMVAR